MQPGSVSIIGFICAASFATVALQVPAADWASTAALSLASGVAALALMGAAAALGSRWRPLESALGGLDRVYEVHKWLGVWALAFASFHLVFKAGMREWDTASILTLPGTYARLARQLGFVALMLIVMLALNRRIPYRSWRWWHKLSGPLFVIVILHWLSIRSPIALASPGGIWMAIMAALGVAGAFYKLLLYPLLSSHAEYRLVDVSSTSSAVLLELEPTRRGIAFEPGQFAFLSIKHDGLREPHPFTIARAGGSDGRVAFVVRALGDHTARLVRDARPGMVADVYAPFGRFERRPGAAREIWIAGGVGVTPFIAWLGDEYGTDMDRATFFHFYTPGRELPDKIDLESMARAHGVELVSVADGPGSPTFRKRFAELVTEAGPTQVQVSFCGPAGLLRQVRALMRKQGMGEHQLQYENFEFR